MLQSNRRAICGLLILLISGICIAADPATQSSPGAGGVTPAPPVAAASATIQPGGTQFQAQYPVPYVLPTADSISEVLHRILAFAEVAMPARVIDRTTGQEITDFTQPIATAVLDRGEANQFSPLDYTMGVTHAGMLSAADATGDARFSQFTAKHMQMLHDRYDYFAAMQKQFPNERNSFGGIFTPTSLDACGAMCSALIKARRANVGPDLKPIIDHWIDFVHTQQFRLPDGTLARHRPQAESLWADDLYMSVPALAQMGKLTGDHQYYDDAARQVLQFSKYLFNPEKGIYMHGRNMDQPDNQEFYWSRANGWAMMATVELLEVLPEDHPDRPEILKLLRANIKGISTLQSGSGLWHQLLDKPDSYLETSGTAMFVYSIARAINRGWISPVGYGDVAQTGWNALATRVNARGQVEGTCVATTFADDNVYYYNRPTSPDASHGYGPVLLAGAEIIKMLKNPNFEVRATDGTFQYLPKN